MPSVPQAALSAGTASFRRAGYRKRRGYSVACLEEKSLCTKGMATHIVEIIKIATEVKKVKTLFYIYIYNRIYIFFYLIGHAQAHHHLRRTS